MTNKINKIEILAIGIFILIGLFTIATIPVLPLDVENGYQMAFARPMQPVDSCETNPGYCLSR